MTLADRILQHTREHADQPDELTVAKIAAALDEHQHVVGFVLDSFYVDEDDKIHYVGTGAGGGWVPEVVRTPEDVLKEQLADNVITQQEHDDRLQLVQRGENPRDAVAMHRLLVEQGRAEEEDAPADTN